MDEPPEHSPESSPYLSLPWPLVVSILAAVLLLALGVGLYANRYLRPENRIPPPTEVARAIRRTLCNLGRCRSGYLHTRADGRADRDRHARASHANWIANGRSEHDFPSNVRRHAGRDRHRLSCPSPRRLAAPTSTTGISGPPHSWTLTRTP